MALRTWAFASACALVLGIHGGAARAAGASSQPSDREALKAATSAMCARNVVLLGEASHGDGHSDAFKVALVEELVSTCQFNTVLFEASFYEFSPVSLGAGQGRAVSADKIGAAVGGLWKFDKEVQPLFDFLAARVNAGALDVGGLDFQAGGFQQPYSNDLMVAELASGLPVERSAVCKAVYRSRVYDDDPPKGMSIAGRDETLKTCLTEIGSALSSSKGDAVELAVHRRELANLQAWVEQAGGDQAQLVRARDRMMADNAAWFIEHSRRKAVKAIIWTHNGHAARDARSFEDFHGEDNLGAALSRRHGHDMYSLGITACAGEYRWSRGSNRPIAAPPGDSLEASFCPRAPQAGKLVGADELRASGKTRASLLGHVYGKADWAEAFDGVLFLDTEFAPHGVMP